MNDTSTDTRECGLAADITQGLGCRTCPRTRAEGPLADCRRHVIERHVGLVRNVVQRAFARSHGRAGEDDVQAAMLHVVYSAAALLASSTGDMPALDTVPGSLDAGAPATAAGELLWFD